MQPDPICKLFDMVKILDTTLREGEQSPGVYFNPEQRLCVAQKLDRVGVDIIEVGNPMVDPEIDSAIREIVSAKLKGTIGVHSLCRRKHVAKALDTGAGFIGIFLNVSNARLDRDYGASLEAVTSELQSVIQFIKSERPEVVVRFTSEDAMRTPVDNILKATLMALDAGADVISIADTTGYANFCIPKRKLSRVIQKLRSSFELRGFQPEIEVHCHNDRGLALANAMDACHAGASIVDSSVLRLGERNGIVDLAELLLCLGDAEASVDRRCLRQLPELYATVSRFTGYSIPKNHPIVGQHTFTHTAGVHISAMAKDSVLYQSIEPALLGRDWDFSLGVQSGIAAIRLALQRIDRTDLAADSAFMKEVLAAVKSRAKAAHVDVNESFAEVVSICEAAKESGMTQTSEQQSLEWKDALRRSEGFEAFPSDAIDGSLIGRFEAMVARYGDRVAVKDSSQCHTYDELNRLSNRIGQSIIEGFGSDPEPVIVLLGHEAKTIAAMIGVLKSGKFYVPVDPSLPKSRLAAIQNSVHAKIVVTDEARASIWASIEGDAVDVVNLDRLPVDRPVSNPNVSIDPDRLAYVIFTSGSSGKPKGVIQSHRTALNNVRNYSNGIFLCPEDRYCLLASFSFSASFSGVFGPLLNGGCVLPFDLKQEGLDNLVRWMGSERISVYHSVPSVFRRLCQVLDGSEDFSNLRLIKLGGEPTLLADVEAYRRQFPDHCTLHVGLGASEINIIRQYFLNKETDLPESRVPVGYPVENVEVIVADEDGRPVECGVEGEIVIKSPYLTPGYWNDEETTQKVITDDHQRAGLKVFRTGDLGRLGADGCLFHLGRKDFQVKIRGQRIELEEIQSALLEIAGVQEAVVAAKPDLQQELHLVAFVVIADGNHDASSELRRALEQRLPQYMVPTRYIFMDALPKTSTGKIDRRGLPDPDWTRKEAAYVAPRNEIEEALQAIWQERLDMSPISVESDFFEIGGHSLVAVELFSLVQKRFGKRLPLNTLFQHPTISSQARLIQNRDALGANSTSLVPIQTEGKRPPIFFIHAGGGDTLSYLRLSRLLGPDQRVYALESWALDGRRKPHESVEQMAAHYIREIKTVQAAGPYYLAGFSFGGKVALEAARQLSSNRDEVGMLMVLDTRLEDRHLNSEDLPSRLGVAWMQACHLAGRLRFHLSRLITSNPGLRAVLSDKMFQWRKRRKYRKLRVEFERGQADAVEFGSIYRRVTAYNRLASRRYSPEIYAGKIVLLEAEDHGIRGPYSNRRNWEYLAGGGLEVYAVPGDHLSMIREPNVETLAHRIRRCMDAALNQRSTNGSVTNYSDLFELDGRT